MDINIQCGAIKLLEMHNADGSAMTEDQKKEVRKQLNDGHYVIDLNHKTIYDGELKIKGSFEFRVEDLEIEVPEYLHEEL